MVNKDGYSIIIFQRDPVSKKHLNKTVSTSDFYAFRMMDKQNQKHYILLYRSLLNQFSVDMFAKIETERLNFIRHSQSKLRVENYVHIKDAMCREYGNVSDM